MWINGSANETTIFIGGLLEKHTVGSQTEYRHAIYAGARPVALYSRPGSGEIARYFLLDHQGSIASITDSAGAVYVNESFSAFGERRDPNDWSGPPSAAEETLIGNASRRGYTLHTNLGGSALIHMNGRVADGLTGRFLSADPYVSAAGVTQAFNRYSYVYNNPLSYTDPSGFEPATFCAVFCKPAAQFILSSFFSALFSKRHRPPAKGCFVAPTGCYGQAGMPRTPGFNSIFNSDWARRAIIFTQEAVDDRRIGADQASLIDMLRVIWPVAEEKKREANSTVGGPQGPEPIPDQFTVHTIQDPPIEPVYFIEEMLLGGIVGGIGVKAGISIFRTGSSALARQLAARFGTSMAQGRLLARLVASDGSLITSRTVAAQLAGPRSYIPVQSILDVVANGVRVVDPQGVAGRFLYSAPATREFLRRSGALRRVEGTLEILVNESDGVIEHVLFKTF